METARIRLSLEQNEIPFSEDLPEKLNIYLSLLNDWNSRMDLTAVTEDEETVDKHFIDSLTVLRTGLIRDGMQLIDVGTGAGFPGIPLKIVRPDIELTLLDSLNKRIVFINDIVLNRLELSAETVHGRAEDFSKLKKYRVKEAIEFSELISKKVISSFIGKPFEVLFENKEKNNIFSGYSRNYIKIKYKSNESLCGKIKKVIFLPDFK